MYKIGQVLYIISNNTRTIEPVQVHSKQTLESFDGTNVQHMCLTTKNDRISLEGQNDKGLLAGIFVTIDEAEAHLLKLASEMVRSLALDAKEKAAAFTPQTKPVEELASAEDDEGSEVRSVTLDNGTKVRLHLPPDIT